MYFVMCRLAALEFRKIPSRKQIKHEIIQKCRLKQGNMCLIEYKHGLRHMKMR